jgi:hypothetical protein
MKNIIYLLLLLSVGISAQTKYLTKTGNIGFEASVPSFEEVKAQSNSVTAIINSETGEFAALAFIKGFRFKNALMEEHFNENYAESHIYPKSKLKGTIKDFSTDKLSDNPISFYLDGELEFHGKTKILKNIELFISIIDGAINISGDFIAYASDYDIKIPKIVRNKIAQDVDVSFSFELKKK